MNIKLFLLRTLLVLVLAANLLSQGCTIKFKGKDLELDARSTVVYQFDGFGFTDATNR